MAPLAMITMEPPVVPHTLLRLFSELIAQWVDAWDCLPQPKRKRHRKGKERKRRKKKRNKKQGKKRKNTRKQRHYLSYEALK